MLYLLQIIMNHTKSFIVSADGNKTYKILQELDYSSFMAKRMKFTFVAALKTHVTTSLKNIYKRTSLRHISTPTNKEYNHRTSSIPFLALLYTCTQLSRVVSVYILQN